MTDWTRFHDIDALREAGNPTQALAEFMALRKGATDTADISSILLGESLCYHDLGRLDEAATAATEAVELLPEESPSRPYAEFSLAVVHESQGKREVAAQELRTLLRTHAKLLSADEYLQFKRHIQLRLIAILIMLGHAIEPLSIAEALTTERLSSKERAEVSYRKAQAHGLMGQQDQALALFREAISLPLESSFAARAHFHVGEILYDRGEFSRALDEFKISEKLAVGNSDTELFTKWIAHTERELGGNFSVGDFDKVQ